MACFRDIKRAGEAARHRQGNALVGVALSLTERILDKAVRLNEAAKASGAVVTYKAKRQEAVTEKLALIDDIVVDPGIGPRWRVNRGAGP